ncbi:HTH-type transcriptional regulator Xre [bioreactor metagenome]|uniref:HTH-type transcriptional regulator Xre n=1 Tax=bioreactor metagenome TaxID=1076179 RepID=A0A645ALX7_9ZZZZ
MFGDKLKELRKGKKATQDDLAAFLNIKRQTYSAYERNISLPDIPSLVKLASFFNVSVDYLISDEIKTIQNEPPLSPEQIELLKSCADLPIDDLKKVIEYTNLLKLKQNHNL